MDPDRLSLALQHVYSLHEVATSATLSEAGISQKALRRLVLAGALVRARTDWYVPAACPTPLLLAARAGGRLTGATLFRELGSWQPGNDGTMHIAIPGSRKRPPADLVPGCRYYRSDEPGFTLREPVHSAILHLLRGTPFPEAIAVLDSLVFRNIVPRLEVLHALERPGTRVARHASRLVQIPSESGVESLLKAHLFSHRIGFHAQVPIGPYRVDFQIGQRLIVEVVGAEFHAGATAFENDARREQFLQRCGFQVLRVTARQILTEIAPAMETIRTLTAHK